jgi:nitrite reductase/ring-hydroxylating ferredoxin subunit
MKKIIAFLYLSLFILSCSSDNVRYQNPFIPNYSFAITIDANLPLYSGLLSPINPIRITNENVGANGIIVMKISDTDYRAWEANCPNQYLTSCSRMVINGVNAKCPCDDIEYSLFNGVGMDGQGQYTMKPYRVDILGNNLIRVSN